MMNLQGLSNQQRLRYIRILLCFFIMALILSGVTAFPLIWEIRMLTSWFGEGTIIGTTIPGLAYWLEFVRDGLEYAGQKYPFLAYGTDWLAFAHIVIAIAFCGPLKDPVRNVWVIDFGMIACLLVIPLALICGPIRGIPLCWRLLDCSFGVFGLIPLVIVKQLTLGIESDEKSS